jgi:protein tyrosine/serine phosphatase
MTGGRSGRQACDEIMQMPFGALPVDGGAPRRLSARQADMELMWRDHGILRQVFSNFHWIGPGMARANQPSPRQLARYADMGFAAILNLRGASDRGHYLLERQACQALGLRLIDFSCSATEPPPKALIFAAQSLFAVLDRPCLMHCKSGSDRTGLMGVLYRHFSEGDPIESALDQLSHRYLHLRSGKAGIMDFFLETYLRETAHTCKPFIDWVIDDYDPIALAAAYKRRPWVLGLIDWLLRRPRPAIPSANTPHG